MYLFGFTFLKKLILERKRKGKEGRERKREKH